VGEMMVENQKSEGRSQIIDFGC